MHTGHERTRWRWRTGVDKAQGLDEKPSPLDCFYQQQRKSVLKKAVASKKSDAQKHLDRLEAKAERCEREPRTHAHGRLRWPTDGNDRAVEWRGAKTREPKARDKALSEIEKE